MPNIELHNFSASGLLVKKTKDDIWKALRNYPDLDEVVVTEVPSSSEKKDRKSAPEYLRVWAGSPDELAEVIKLLKPLSFDIEPALLGSEFVPGKSEQQKAQEALMTLRPTSGTDPNFNYKKGRLYTEEELEQSRRNTPGNH